MGYNPLLNKREYIIGAMTAIGSKFHMNFYYDYLVKSEVLEGVLFNKVTGKTKWFRFDLGKMNNVDEALNDIERYLRDYGFDEEPRNPFMYNDHPYNVKPKYVSYKEMSKDKPDRNYKKLANKLTGELLELKNLFITNVIFNDPATIVFWSDGTKTVVKTRGNDKFDPEKGLAMAICKKHMGNADGWYKEFKKWLPEEKEDPIDIYESAAVKLITEAVEEISKSARDAINRINKAIY